MQVSYVIASCSPDIYIVLSIRLHSITMSQTELNVITPRPSRPTTPTQKPKLAVDTFQCTNTPYHRLQKSRLTNMTATTAVAPDIHLVDDLNSGMKATLHALGKTFDALSDQTGRMSELGPALQALHNVSVSFKHGPIYIYIYRSSDRSLSSVSRFHNSSLNKKAEYKKSNFNFAKNSRR